MCIRDRLETTQLQKENLQAAAAASNTADTAASLSLIHISERAQLIGTTISCATVDPIFDSKQFDLVMFDEAVSYTHLC